MNVITRGKIPVKIWTNYAEDGAIEQAINLSNLPFAYKHIALMPDVHQGYGMPIGGVLAAKNAIVPNAVGVDIGCGMIAVKTNLLVEEINNKLKDVMSIVRRNVPVGFKHHANSQNHEMFDNHPLQKIISNEIQSAKYQLGTLGGGNHFIEWQSDGTHVWMMLHSGSRNFGYKIANHYHKIAKELCEKYFSNIPSSDLAFLPLDSDEATKYIDAMHYALKFAQASRQLMMESMMNAMSDVYNGINFYAPINIHHNYARMENHFGKNVMIHRKGATSAKKGEMGIIPGSQGTKSYIVKGKGNPESFMSCSHGAGRAMSRTKARNMLSLEDEIKKLDDSGIIHSIRDQKDLDEASSAYKEIDIVMKNQKDLVDIEVELTPLAVIKG